MNHPMYGDKLYAVAYEGYKKFPDKFYSLIREYGDKSEAMMLHVRTMDCVAKEGHVVVDIDGEDWESDISEKTLAEVRPVDVKFPFRACAIMDKNISEGYMLFSIRDGRLNVSFQISKEDGSIGVISQVIDINKKLGVAMSDFTMGTKEVYRAIAVLMYISSFRREKNRVKDFVTNKLKASKKRSIPSHKIHTVLVRQPKVSSGATSSGKRSKSSMSWIVKGHWRNQWYASVDDYKPKWIDPYFKGKGKEKISKIYKVS